MITAVVLSPSLDISYEVDELTVGAIHRPLSTVRCAGGKGLNMVRAATALGAPTRAVTVLGGPVGDLMRTLLAEEGLPAVVVPNPHETRICVSVAGADMTEIYQRATPLADGVLDDVEAALDEALAGGTDWVAVNGGLPEGADPARVADLLARARHHGARVAADCYGELLTELLERGVDLVKINRSEAVDLVGTAPDVDLSELVAAVAARASAPVVVTDGASGSALSQDGRRWRVAASSRRGRWSQGSGDSYLGGLLTGLTEGLGLVDAVRLGAGAGTANAMVPGPGRLREDEARAIAAELAVTTV
ncbi:1-phosphofructokinase family hexose kinase [Auraticoccus monumenti]|uniref:Tagatose 6-phosphate kinase n=1 Tax=Auraticoccus monumenti TaxID=675864 RepID=A0A1G6RK21_9ACTN|nr:PfkB family carbohydrate kinase [Auraticoccus monumenti]SDD04327.1 tagatose 6-phosphate kinase [Auraticoccus monumenti]